MKEILLAGSRVSKWVLQADEKRVSSTVVWTVVKMADLWVNESVVTKVVGRVVTMVGMSNGVLEIAMDGNSVARVVVLKAYIRVVAKVELTVALTVAVMAVE